MVCCILLHLLGAASSARVQLKVFLAWLQAAPMMEVAEKTGGQQPALSKLKPPYSSILLACTHEHTLPDGHGAVSWPDLPGLQIERMLSPTLPV